MTEFKVPINHPAIRRRERNLHLMVWAVVALMSAITLFSIYGVRSENPQLVTALGCLAFGILAITVVGAHFLAFRLGLEKLARDSTFLLTDKEVIRKRRGWPDIQIGFSEIRALHQRSGWLSVESNQPGSRIAIPEQVEGFKALRAELLQHSQIAATPKTSPIRFIPLVASLICWGLVLCAKDARVLMTAGFAALFLLAWAYFRFTGLIRQNPKRTAISLLLGLSWLVAASFIYFRIIRIAS